MFPIDGVAKLKLDDCCNDGAVAVEKFGENCGVAQLSRPQDCDEDGASKLD